MALMAIPKVNGPRSPLYSLRQVVTDFSLSRKLQLEIFLSLDALTSLMAASLATSLSPYATDPINLEKNGLGFTILFAVSFVCAAITTGLYDVKRLRIVSEAIVRSVLSAFLACMIAVCAYYLFFFTIPGRYEILIAAVFSAMLAASTRAISRGLLLARDHKILFLGRESSRELLMSEIKKRKISQDVVFAKPHQLVFCESQDLDAVSNSMNCFRPCALADVVVIESGCPLAVLECLVKCSACGMPVIDFLRYYEEAFEKIPHERIDCEWLLSRKSHMSSPAGRAIKRGMDVAISSAAIMLLLPIWAIVVPLLKLAGDGSVIYKQERLGRGGKPFLLMKFRTMVANAESDGRPVWASESDPRVTRIGRFLRKTRFDETPQFINVLLGEMSVIGPRPERPDLARRVGKHVPGFNLRTVVKPGITGWAQLMYRYGADTRDASEKLRYDLYYIKNASVLFDLRILVATVGAIGRGAR